MTRRGGPHGPINARDYRGWKIPRDGTKAYVVYMAMVAGDPLNDAAQVIDRPIEQVRVIADDIRHPDRKPARARRQTAMQEAA
jgi:hypothetical protein